jgi:hypothetical protein
MYLQYIEGQFRLSTAGYALSLVAVLFWVSLYIALGRTRRKTRPLPSSGRLLLSRIAVSITWQRTVYEACHRGKVFIEPLPSNGSIRYNIY